jgi:hypothetical protein
VIRRTIAVAAVLAACLGWVARAAAVAPGEGTQNAPIPWSVTLEWVGDVALSTERGLPPGTLQDALAPQLRRLPHARRRRLAVRQRDPPGHARKWGRVYAARWISLQLVDGLPRPDPTNASAQLVATLSHQDFPADHFQIAPNGVFQLPALQ